MILTLQYAVENNFTCIDCIKFFKPDWNDAQCLAYSFNNGLDTFKNGYEFIEQLNKLFDSKIKNYDTCI